MVIVAAAPLREEKAPGAAANETPALPCFVYCKCCSSAFFAMRIRGAKCKFVKKAEAC